MELNKIKDKFSISPKLEKEIVSFIESQDGLVREFLTYLYQSMSVSDAIFTEREDLLDYCKAAKVLREGRCKDMEESLFLDYVLYHRVNTERVTANRTKFQEILFPMLTDDDFENVKRINYWAASQVVYQTTDTRTLEVMKIWESGFGRCGEESTFFVSACRACGIPARQLYVPWWSHCDDNHAWVEVYVNGKWQYLGACEPEEILNKGWFDDASARAMLVFSKTFPKPKHFTYFDGEVYYVNRTSNYADTIDFKLKFTLNKQVAVGADIEFQVLNFGGFRTITRLTTDDLGEVELEVGIGDVFLICRYLGENYFIRLNTKLDNEKNIDLDDFKSEYERWEEFIWQAPSPSDRNRKDTPKKKEVKYIEKAFPNENARKTAFSLGLENLWESLNEKDKRDIRVEVLEDCKLTNESLADDIFLKYLLNPRVYIEHLKPCRKTFSKHFKCKEDILEFIDEIRVLKDKVLVSPVDVFNYKVGNKLSIKVFAVAAFRSIGILSKLEDEQVYIYNENDFELIDIFNENSITETYKLEFKGDLSYYGVKWNLTRIVDEGCIYIEEKSIKDKSNLVKGKYLLTTINRLPNGNACVKEMLIDLNKNLEITLSYMETELKNILSHNKLPESIKSKLENDKSKKYKLVILTDENSEPSRHVVNELCEDESLLNELDLFILFKESYLQKDESIKRLLSKTKVNIIENIGDELTESFGRSLFVNHELLPIVSLCNEDFISIYGFSGYQVGTATMLESIIKL